MDLLPNDKAQELGKGGEGGMRFDSKKAFNLMLSSKRMLRFTSLPSITRAFLMI